MARKLAVGLGVGLLFVSSWLFAIGVLSVGGWVRKSSDALEFGTGIFVASSVGACLVSRRPA